MWYNAHMEKKCFMIQPFDGGEFDERYDNVYAPAIEQAGLVPYRVDHDPGAEFPMEEIKSGIRDAAVCLADITKDNFNVALEIGMAIAWDKPLVLVRSEERKDKLPFDVQDRNVIFYKPDTSSDFDKLRSRISEQLKARMNSAATPRRPPKFPRYSNKAEFDDDNATAFSRDDKFEIGGGVNAGTYLVKSAIPAGTNFDDIADGSILKINLPDWLANFPPPPSS